MVETSHYPVRLNAKRNLSADVIGNSGTGESCTLEKSTADSRCFYHRRYFFSRMFFYWRKIFKRPGRNYTTIFFWSLKFFQAKPEVGSWQKNLLTGEQIFCIPDEKLNCFKRVVSTEKNVNAKVMIEHSSSRIF